MVAGGTWTRVYELILAFVEDREKPVKCFEPGCQNHVWRLDVRDQLRITSADRADLRRRVPKNCDEFIQMDFEHPLSWNLEKSFPLIVAMEIIEHLYSPYLFVENLARHLDPDGLLVLTTPCNDSPWARKIFYETGGLPWFGPDNVKVHCSPLHEWQLENYFDHAGLRVASKSYNYPDLDDGGGNIGRPGEIVIYGAVHNSPRES